MSTDGIIHPHKDRILRLVTEYGAACGQAGEHRAAAKHSGDQLTRAQHDTTAKNATDHAVALYRSILDHLIGPPPEPDPIVMPPRQQQAEQVRRAHEDAEHSRRMWAELDQSDKHEAEGL